MIPISISDLHMTCMHSYVYTHTYAHICIYIHVCVPHTNGKWKNIPRQLLMNTVCSHWEMFVVMLHWNITSKSF